METIKNRSELLFLYDVKDGNPNGDPMAGNRVRFDEESKKCLVTDLRLKRTVRDYLMNYKNQPIFIREVKNDEGYVSTVKDLLNLVLPDKTFNSTQEAEKEGRKLILEKFTDIRLFGGTIPLAVKVKKKAKKAKGVADTNEDKKEEEDKGSITMTGPVQFSIGRSLHQVRENNMGLSMTIATKEKSKTGSLAPEGRKTIYYGLIGFHGVINENAAKHTGLTDKDVKLLLEGIWEGTRNLLTQSKKTHMPRLLIKIDYKNSFFIGDLLERIKLQPVPVNEKKKKEDEFQDISEFIIDVSELNRVLESNMSKIENVWVKKDERANLSTNVLNQKDLVFE